MYNKIYKHWVKCVRRKMLQSEKKYFLVNRSAPDKEIKNSLPYIRVINGLKIDLEIKQNILKMLLSIYIGQYVCKTLKYILDLP